MEIFTLKITCDCCKKASLQREYCARRVSVRLSDRDFYKYAVLEHGWRKSLVGWTCPDCQVQATSNPDCQTQATSKQPGLSGTSNSK